MQFLDWLQYKRAAQNAYALHSPFVYELYTKVIQSRQNYYAYQEIELLYNSLKKNKTKINIQDFGAGSKVFKDNEREITQIIRYSSSSLKTGKLLFRLINYLQPQYLLELGTCLGISTLFMAKANPKTQLYTLEGCPNLAAWSRKNFLLMDTSNIELIEGNIPDTLSLILQKIPQVDFAFLDANHQYQATLDYFEAILEKIHSDSVLVLDDIYWSKGMKKAWQEIQNHPNVYQTINLFQLGLVFFREQQARQHFVLKF